MSTFSLGHRLPHLALGLSGEDLQSGDDAVGLGDDISVLGPVHQLGGLDPLPHEHLGPGSVEVDGHPGKSFQLQQGPLLDIVDLQGRPKGPGRTPRRRRVDKIAADGT